MPPDTGVLRSRRARGYEGTLRRMHRVLSRICATSIKAILYEVTFTLNCKYLFVIKAYKPCTILPCSVQLNTTIRFS